MILPRPAIRIVEVGPRDGLQSHAGPAIPTNTKIELIRRLRVAGLSTIEITSIVNPKVVPQLADGQNVLANAQIQELLSQPGVRGPVLIPNLRGLDIALQKNVGEIAVFVSASEGFSRANIRCSVREGLDRAGQVARLAISAGVAVRGYISCVFTCPFDGPTRYAAVLDCATALLDMGCYEISLGDTVGEGVPTNVESLIRYLVDRGIPTSKLAGHFHDTYGQAIANVWAAYGCGVRVFDSSVAGLGGCPYAPGAKGNLATEDLVYTMHQAGVDTGVSLHGLVETGVWIAQKLGVPNASRAGSAIASKTYGKHSNSTRTKYSSPLACREPQQSADGVKLCMSRTRIPHCA